jgi:hypothetical protein
VYTQGDSAVNNYYRDRYHYHCRSSRRPYPAWLLRTKASLKAKSIAPQPGEVLEGEVYAIKTATWCCHIVCLRGKERFYVKIVDSTRSIDVGDTVRFSVNESGVAEFSL